jgi:hypothetical protein
MAPAPFVPQLVVQRWVTTVLKADPAVVAAVGAANRIFPNLVPTDQVVRQLVHSFAGPAGGREVVKPIGSPIGQAMLFWDLTAWEPRFSQQAVEPLMQAVMAVLIGSETRGKRHRFIDVPPLPSRGWDLDCDYVDDQYVPLDTAQALVWAPVRQRYRVFLRPLTAG